MHGEVARGRVTCRYRRLVQEIEEPGALRVGVEKGLEPRWVGLAGRRVGRHRPEERREVLGVTHEDEGHVDRQQVHGLAAFRLEPHHEGPGGLLLVRGCRQARRDGEAVHDGDRAAIEDRGLGQLGRFGRRLEAAGRAKSLRMHRAVALVTPEHPVQRVHHVLCRDRVLGVGRHGGRARQAEDGRDHNCTFQAHSSFLPAPTSWTAFAPVGGGGLPSAGRRDVQTDRELARR